MTTIQKIIYEEGTIIETKKFTDGHTGDEIVHEYVLCDDEKFLFCFSNGTFFHMTKV